MRSTNRKRLLPEAEQRDGMGRPPPGAGKREIRLRRARPDRERLERGLLG
jgi:hypothetical protein